MVVAVSPVNMSVCDVTVIIPTYNRVHTLARALDSVFQQTLQPVAIIVVDDGSDDDTERFIRNRYPNVVYCRQENRGVSSARNHGVVKSQSQWVAFLDSDDEWMPQKLAKQMQALQHDPGHQLVHCNEIWIRRGVRVNPHHKHAKSGGYIFERCLPLCVISPSAVVMKKALFQQVGGFDESLPACEDYDLWLRICCQHSVLYLEEPLLRKYGGHEDQLSRKHWGMDRFRVTALQKLLESAVLSDEQYSAAREILLQKLAILHAGARKRGNEKLCQFCTGLASQYEVEGKSCHGA